MCRIFGALNVALSRISASWAATRLSREAALDRSSQRLDSARFIAAPVVSGAPRSSALSIVKWINCWKTGSADCVAVDLFYFFKINLTIFFTTF